MNAIATPDRLGSRATVLAVVAVGLCGSVSCVSGNTLSLRYGEAVAGKTMYSPRPVFPSDGVRVLAEVVAVAHPFVSSPSIVGDRSTASLRIVSGKVPAAPNVERIELAFDQHSVSPMPEKGERLVLRFTAAGRLFDIVSAPVVDHAP